MIVTEYEVGPHGIALGPGRSVWIALEAGTLIHLTESD